MLDNLKLLYAEDDEQTRKNTSDIFSLMFDKVITAKDGKEALTLYEKESPHVIMLDIEMPFMSGLEVAKKIRETNRHVPIVIITAYRDTKYFLQAVELHLTTYILKPITIEDLQRAIKMCKEELNYAEEEKIYIREHIYYELSSRELHVNGNLVSLSNMEMHFLEYLLKNPNRVITYNEFENCLWEEGMSSAAIRSLVRDLRSFTCKECIINVPKVGYKLVLS